MYVCCPIYIDFSMQVVPISCGYVLCESPSTSEGLTLRMTNLSNGWWMEMPTEGAGMPWARKSDGYLVGETKET